MSSAAPQVCDVIYSEEKLRPGLIFIFYLKILQASGHYFPQTGPVNGSGVEPR